MNHDYGFYNNENPNFEKLENGKFFIDDKFKNNDESIFGKFDETWDLEQKEEYNKKKEQFKEEILGFNKEEEISWIRIFDSNKKIPFAKEEKKLDIKQGFLGDCYFIAYIHGLRKNYPDIFNSIIGNCQFDKGYFEIYIYYHEENGEITKKKIFVDDYIPYGKFPKTYESLYYPLFSSYFTFSKEINDPRFQNYMIGQYLLIEKAFAKYKGSYLNIESDLDNLELYFLLTGVEIKISYLTDDFLMKHQNLEEIKIKKEKEIEKEMEENKEEMIKEIKEENKEENIKEIEEYIKSIVEIKLKAEVKREAIKILDKEGKEKIFDEMKKFSKTNLINAGTEDKINIGEKTTFGIYSNHMYDFLDCENQNDSLFFSLWNPHGMNELNDKYNNKYEGFDVINKRNKEGLFNGDIILNFDNFFLSFSRLSYQNREELIKMHKNYNTKGFLDLLETPHMNIFFRLLFGYDINFFIAIMLIRKEINKNKSSKEILYDLLNEIKNEEMNKFQFLYFLSVWDDVKKDIIKESEDIMTKKSKSNLNTTDKEEIIKILIEENKNKNEFIVMFSKTNITILKEKLEEINKDIESIAKRIAEEYIKKNKKEEKKVDDCKTTINYFNFSLNEEIVIRSSLAYKNLDIEGNNINSETKIILYDAHGGESQSFLKVDNYDGTFTFRKYGYAIDVRYSEIKNGTIIQIWEYNGTNAQKFYLRERGNGYVSIHSAINQNYCIDVSGGCTNNFNKIQLWEYQEGNNNQKFKLISIDNQREENRRRGEEEENRRRREEEENRRRREEEENRRRREEEHKRHIEDLARRVIRGEFGSGNERMNRLGGEFKEVQNKVNEMLGCSFRYKI